MNDIGSSLLAKANYVVVAVAEAAGTLPKGVVRWAAWASPRLAAAVEAMMVGIARGRRTSTFEVA